MAAIWGVARQEGSGLRRRRRDFARARKLLASLTIVALGGRDIAIRAAQNYGKLRALGVTTRKTIDTIITACCIATRCIEDKMPLLYSDRDFDPFVEKLSPRSAMG